ncbi:hypothetical protein ACN38_g1739 [Penicillium nordicum]|uniref:Uncharacterized protein n=1 Tax=Penicillium nordicum TaxID=229535 RepID=A0A0M9WJI0_9EURO|nr:hypothetical protein ACN38_g1739 [Penicillium nordicum]
MSILPEDALDIGRGRKTTVSRIYRLPVSVRRIWFYTTSPLQYIEYVVCISYNEAESNTSNKNPTYSYKCRQIVNICVQYNLRIFQIVDN